MSDVLWQLQNVGLTTRQHCRLRSLTLNVQAGVTAVLGESGAGKTSLLNLLVGIDSPTTGSLLAAEAKDTTRPFVYWVPQDHGLWPHLSAAEHIAMVESQATGSEHSGDAAPQPDWLNTFDLSSRRDARPAQLSQGERARLSVARALATRAEVQLMDEPLAHVDAARRAMYWTAIEQHIRESGASWVFATHDPATVLAHADHVVALKHGELLFHGKVSTLYRFATSEEAARCLGDVNWLPREDAAQWLVNPPDTIEQPDWPCFRPEHLEIKVDPAGTLAVESFVFRGPTSHVTLHHTTSNDSRPFIVRTPAWPMQAGTRVHLHSLRDAWEVPGE